MKSHTSVTSKKSRRHTSHGNKNTKSDLKTMNNTAGCLFKEGYVDDNNTKKLRTHTPNRDRNLFFKQDGTVEKKAKKVKRPGSEGGAFRGK